MKIPDAYFDGGFGQRVARPQGQVRPDVQGSEAIAHAGMQLGAQVGAVGANLLEEEGRNELRQAVERKQEAERLQREQEAEMKRMQELREHSAAKAQYFGFEDKLNQIHQTLIDDPDVAPEDYPTEFRKRATEHVTAIQGKLNEKQWLTIGPDVQHRVDAGAELMFKTGQKELQDSAWADDIAAAEALMNNPAKSAREKITIIKDENFFADSGRPAHEIEATRQKLIDTAIENEVVTALNNTKGNTKALKQFRDTIRAQSEDGQYKYMPEMDIKSRERYVDLAQSAIRSAEAEAKREAREAETARRQAAGDAFNIYKDAKEGLAPLSIKDEARLLRQMQGTPYFDRAKAIHRATTSFGYEMEKVKEDPLTYGAARMGLSIPPLDPRQAADWPRQLAVRGEVAKRVQAVYGLSFLPVLTNQEAHGLGELFKEQSPQGMVRMLTQMKSIPGMGRDTIKQVGRQFAAAGNPEAGTVVSLIAEGKTVTAYNVANGQRLLREKGIELDKVATDTLSARFEKQIGSAVSHLPQAKTALKSAVGSAYLSAAAAKGIAPDDFDKKLYDDAFASVVGETVRVNGKQVLPPSGWNQERFYNSWRKLDGKIIQSGGGIRGFTDPNKAAEYVLDEGKLWEAGDGYYWIEIDGKFLQTQDGRDFMLRFRDR
jgi:hypothetical protein